jgi:4-amino-4-deoxy-L-arabinose transferase-like glycosyltransferase
MKNEVSLSPKIASPWAQGLVYATLGLLLIIGIVCLIASRLPYSSLVEMLQRQYGGELTAKRLTREFYEQKQLLVRMVGFSALLLAAIISWWRAALTRLLAAQFDYLHRGWERSVNLGRYAFRHTDKSEIFDVFVLTTVGLIDRLFFLSQPVRFDEASSYLDYASKPLYLLVSIYTEPENHVFNSLLTHFSTAIFGNHLWALRLPALTAGTLMVPLTYLACRQLYGRLPAVVAASLVATSSILIEFSANSRGYMILGCCFLLLIFVATLLQRKTDPLLFLLLAVCTAIGFYTIPIMLFPAGAIFLWLALSVRKKRPTYAKPFAKFYIVSLILAGLLTVTFYSPIFVVSGVKAVIANPTVAKLNFASFISKNLRLLRETWQVWNRDLTVWGMLLLPAGFVLSLLLPLKNLDRHRRFIAAIFAWCLAALAVFRFAPFARVWLFLLPVYFMAAAAGLVYLGKYIYPHWRGWKPTWRIVAFSVLIVLSLQVLSKRADLDSPDSGSCHNAEQVANFLLQNQIPIRQVFRSATCNMPLLYYYLPKSGSRLQEIRFLPLLEDDHAVDVASGISPRSPQVLWVFVNSSRGDTLNSVLRRDNLGDLKVLARVDYDRGYLCQIQLER